MRGHCDSTLALTKNNSLFFLLAAVPVELRGEAGAVKTTGGRNERNEYGFDI